MALSALQSRHTIRNYVSDYEIAEEELKMIIETARIAPTAYTVQDVNFLVCSNKEKNQEATNARLSEMDEQTQNIFESRKSKMGVSNVITCDASVEVIIYSNEHKSESVEIHAGIAAMSIMVAAKEFGLDTMPHVAMIGRGSEKIYGIPEGTSIVAVAIGKAKPDAYISKRQYNNTATYLK